ncbi:hypothetical protein FC83_GL003334 [Agrilactobacillus composti DSM 18527 = JCM 14202]|jgi:hypothetical protein|uniref:Uncharacterized protein n=1 Tax=Agrilactobacillus composti DSM 18527 = JCM 14202 TaxID=1423734 RepID=X0PF71_9LACO|nr:hypothetical protein [Agrilactobacillus composti]KRM33250.1 hypothetical protein FC83_GL003334 [Agrilactobacillus composti DSM 18527 = JCM 14202]MCH4169584.1 hypothetical protein [Lactobacillus sp.]GAF40323.1 hypothetical protein JCM14202_2217 [Agrilactobacillus composti DSM 18527 = JCM 14202]
MSIFVLILDVGMFASAAYSVYWQSQIILRARYNYFSAILGIVFSAWILATPAASNWPYIVAVSLFILVSIMNGVGGVGSRRLVTTGFFSRVIDYKTFAEVTLIPIDLPGGKNRVVGIFMTSTQQRVQLTFNQTVEAIRSELQKHIPDNVEINVENINQL